MDYMKKYKLWLTSDYFDSAVKRELAQLSDDEIEDRFACDLEFGTGGLRGKIGVGTNRMNIYTVRKASQGLANYVLAEKMKDRGIAIAYDSRRMSPEFAKEAALCFCANGIRVYIFESLRPTPELSFAVRSLQCAAGIVITASHNPPEYNGYKVYWEDGGQITYPRDKEIIAEVNKVVSYDQVKTMAEEDALKAGLLHVIGEEVDKSYLEELKKQILNPEAISAQADQLRIVYTPLHGTGNRPVRRILRELGFSSVYCVPEQEEPDGDFPTVSYPNPEDPKAFQMALDLAEKVDADIVLATDPDADRLGVYVKDHAENKYIRFTGNMTGALICDYELSQRKAIGKLPADGVVVTTIVSGKMAQAIAEEYGVRVVRTLTGFKYIGEQIKLFEQTGKGTYLFGYEESYGCLTGTCVRDKDAVAAAMVLCEMAAYYKGKNMTLLDRMQELWQKYGVYREELYTVVLDGLSGQKQIQSVMERVRMMQPEHIGGMKVLKSYDYGLDILKDHQTGKISKTGLIKSEVLYFELEDNAWCCIRPSGTEPKIKVYAGVKGRECADADKKMSVLMDDAVRLLQIE